MGIIAPGDLRNCLVALADKESVLEQLFQYRFGGEGELAGHSLGNLFLAALIKEFGNPQNALEAASKVLNIRGQVIPATPERVRLVAKMSDGSLSKGSRKFPNIRRRQERRSGLKSFRRFRMIRLPSGMRCRQSSRQTLLHWGREAFIHRSS